MALEIDRKAKAPSHVGVEAGTTNVPMCRAFDRLADVLLEIAISVSNQAGKSEKEDGYDKSQ